MSMNNQKGGTYERLDYKCSFNWSTYYNGDSCLQHVEDLNRSALYSLCTKTMRKLFVLAIALFVYHGVCRAKVYTTALGRHPANQKLEYEADMIHCACECVQDTDEESKEFFHCMESRGWKVYEIEYQ